MVGLSIEETSPELPSMCKLLKLEGTSVSPSRRFPPSCSVAGSRGLISLVVPTSALPPADGAGFFPPEQPVSTTPAMRAATANRPAQRRIFCVIETMLAAAGVASPWAADIGQRFGDRGQPP